MNRKWHLFIVVFLSSILLGLIGCGGTAKNEGVTGEEDFFIPYTIPSGQHTIANWVVEGTMTTESFTITKVPWCVCWEFTPAALSFFEIDIRHSDGRHYSKPIATTSNLNLVLVDLRCNDDKGTFYLKITAQGGVARVWVTEYK